MFVPIDLLINAYKSGAIKEEYIDIDIKRYPENIHLLYDQLQKMYTEFLGITFLPNIGVVEAFSGEGTFSRSWWRLVQHLGQTAIGTNKM